MYVCVYTYEPKGLALKGAEASMAVAMKDLGGKQVCLYIYTYVHV